MTDTTAIVKVSYTHDAMIDLIVAKPFIAQADIARHFGYTQGWVSRVIRSDAFREILARRKHELVDPLIIESIETGFEALVAQSLEILRGKLEADPSAELALKTAELGTRALGYGAKGTGVTLNQQFIVHVPPKATSSQEWLEDRQPTSGRGKLIEASPSSISAD